MKKSEFVEQETRRLFELEGWSFLLPEHHKRVDLTVQQRTEAAERAGIIWDPETLWEAPATEDVYATRILLDGSIEAQDEDGEWGACDDPTSRELARRLLAERELGLKEAITPQPPAWEDLSQEIIRLTKDRDSWKEQANLWWGRAVERGRLLAEREHVTDGSPCWCGARPERPKIEDIPEVDSAAVAKTAAWIEEERKSRDLGGEVKAVEVEPRFARIVKVGDPSWWYAKHVGKVFEVERIRADGVVVRWPSLACTFIVEPEDVEYLEFLDLGS